MGWTNEAAESGRHRRQAAVRVTRTIILVTVLAVLSVMLKKAVEWQVIERMPCTIRLLRVPKPAASFHDFDEYGRLIDAARSIDRPV